MKGLKTEKFRHIVRVQRLLCLSFCKGITKGGTLRPSSLWGCCVSSDLWRPSRGSQNLRLELLWFYVRSRISLLLQFTIFIVLPSTRTHTKHTRSLKICLVFYEGVSTALTAWAGRRGHKVWVVGLLVRAVIPEPHMYSVYRERIWRAQSSYILPYIQICLTCKNVGRQILSSALCLVTFGLWEKRLAEHPSFHPLDYTKSKRLSLNSVFGSSIPGNFRNIYLFFLFFYLPRHNLWKSN